MTHNDINGFVDKALKSTLKLYRDIFYINLKVDTYRLVYSENKETYESGCFSDTVKQKIKYGILDAKDKFVLYECLSIENIRSLLRNKDYTEIRYRRKLPDGEMEWCITCVTVLSRENGEPVEAAMLIRSVDIFVSADEREHELVKVALEQAELSNKSKSEFLSQMSHDMRTPLHSILGMTKIAQLNYEKTGYVQETLEKIHTSGMHLLRLIDSILDLKTIENVGLDLKNEPFTISGIVNTISSIIIPQAEKKRQKLIMENEISDDYSLLGDERRIVQILLNIIENAVKYTGENGRIEVTVKQRVSPEDSLLWYVTIKDNGYGMNEEELNQVFNPYFRANHKNVGGNGLGLTIAKKIAVIMGGDILVKSQPNVGTEFKVFFQNQKNISDEKNTYTYNLDYMKSKRILIIDDDLMNLEIAKELLTYCGMITETVTDGRKAIEMLMNSSDNYYDAVITDIRMPEISGFDIAKAIRNSERNDINSIPILAISADMIESTINRGIESGVDAFIPKPVELEEGLEIIYRAIKSRERI